MRLRGWLYYLLLVAGVGLLLLGARLTTGRAQDRGEAPIDPKDAAACLACHEDKVDLTKFQASGHGKMACLDCHKDMEQFPHPDSGIRKPACATCHGDIIKRMAGSVHGKSAGSKAPTCATCHGASIHEMPALSKAPPATQQASCITCHPKPMKALKGSVHGTALAGPSALTCQACHGKDVHGIAKPAAAVGTRAGACATCHAKEARAVAGGAHAKGADCLTCHGAQAHATAPAKRLLSRGKDTACRACHAAEAKAIGGSVHAMKGSCLSCHGAHAHNVTVPKTDAASDASCATCHTVVADQFRAGAHHGKTDPKTGKPITCLTCHGGATAHQVTMPAARSGDSSCKTCHVAPARAVAGSVHGRLDPKTGVPVSCRACHGGGTHNVTLPKPADTARFVASCATCHPTQAQAFTTSAHARPDMRAGDHPNCLTCHSGTAHGMTGASRLTSQQKTESCVMCHGDSALMRRYGLTEAPASSFQRSVHGVAALRDGGRSVTCADCHTAHGVLASSNAASPTHPDRLTHTCGACHPGTGAGFAGDNVAHPLRPMIDRPPHPVEILFQAVMLVPLVLMGLLMLRDLRMRLRRRDAADRIAAVGIAAAFVVLVAGMVLAAMERPGAEYAWLVAPALLGAAFIAEGTYGWRAPRHHRTRTKPCNLLTLRVQHDALALAIALLALTGIPRHFAEIAWIRNLLIPVGGFAGAALLHRAAGVLLLAVLAWHLCYLLVRWGRAGWSWRSWTMRPIWQDIPDLAHALGLRREPARCGPRRYREKLSYLAQMSAVVMLCATGLVLWFPDMLGGRLPRWVFEVTRAAHSYEFVLALLAVVVWHLYNVHAMARRVTFARYREKGCATAPDGTGTVRDGTSRADTPSPEGTKDDHGHNA